MDPFMWTILVMVTIIGLLVWCGQALEQHRRNNEPDYDKALKNAKSQGQYTARRGRISHD